MIETSTRKVNTNNGWGFGGFIGTITEYDNGIVWEKGKNCYRHSGTSPRNHFMVHVDEDFYITIQTNTLPTSDVYIYVNNESYRAVIGEATDLDVLFGYETTDAKLFKIVGV